MPILRRALSAFLFVATLSASAQSYPIDKIVFKGGAPYTDAELLATSGLKPGDVLTMKTLANPAQNLLNTGLFDDAGMDLGGPGNRTAIIELKATPLNTLMPASFQNFIWWTPQELAEEIHKRVPLFRGVCSDAGNFPDLIQAALEQMLGEKGIQATTTHTIIEPTTEHPHAVVNFVVTKPLVRLQDINISGVPPELADRMQTLTRMMSRASDINQGLAGITTDQVLLSPAQDSGYVTAHLADEKLAILPGSEIIGVNLTAQLVAGDRYKVAAIAWQPTPLVSDGDFAKVNQLHPGDIASAKLLRQTEAKIMYAYRGQGYIDAYIQNTPVFHSADHTVSYALSVVPGEQYRVKSVSALNLSPEAQAEFDAAWRMKPGEIYNENYVANFVTNNSALKYMSKYSGGFHAVGDPQTHLVVLTLTFVPSAM